MNKKCNRCGCLKSISYFSKNNSKKDGLQLYCKECAAKFYRNHYDSNKDKYLANVRLHKDLLSKEIKAYKESAPCKDCNNSYPSYVMHFDHLRDKIDNVSTLQNQGCRFKTYEEMTKCDLLCSNCHAIRTYKRRPLKSRT